MTTAGRLLLVFIVWAAAPSPLARAEGRSASRAKRHFEAGRSQFELGHAKAALREFDVAYSLDPRPLLLYNAGLAARRAADDAAALDRFRRFLQEAPNAVEREEVRRYVSELES